MDRQTSSATLQLLFGKAKEIHEIITRHKGNAVWVFGSVARGDDGPDSDVDLLVEFEATSSLFDLIRLQDDLEGLLGRPVDVVSRGGVKRA